MPYKLHITGPYESKTVSVDGELIIGRTDQANLALEDSGLSRVNTTFFIDDGEMLVADENSTNGTFVNGEKIVGRPRVLKNGDEIKIGSSTKIRVEIGEVKSVEGENASVNERASVAAIPAAAPTAASKPIKDQRSKAKGQKSQTPLFITSAAATVLILLFGGVGIYLIAQRNNGQTGKPTSQSRVIPMRVIDPLGGEDENDVADLIASWETAETEIDASTVSDVTVMSTDAEEAELNVSATKLAEAQRRAFEDRPGEKGIRPAALAVPKELMGDGVIKQKAKLREMNARGYQQPMDFADLAAKRMSRDLIEVPMATDSYYLDVGGSAQDSPFMSFRFNAPRDDVFPIVTGHAKFDSLKRLADNFSGQRYDLENPGDRKQMRRRLLRMFQPRAKPILVKLSLAYYQQFQRPLRVTSLTRSMDYQILLNQGNANSFKVRGEGSLPPHTSGCAFDLARKHMPVQEQNFLMQELAKMERAGELDALIEYGANACFHVFIYHDGAEPRM